MHLEFPFQNWLDLVYSRNWKINVSIHSLITVIFLERNVHFSISIYHRPMHACMWNKFHVVNLTISFFLPLMEHAKFPLCVEFQENAFWEFPSYGLDWYCSRYVIWLKIQQSKIKRNNKLIVRLYCVGFGMLCAKWKRAICQ